MSFLPSLGMLKYNFSKVNETPLCLENFHYCELLFYLWLLYCPNGRTYLGKFLKMP